MDTFDLWALCPLPRIVWPKRVAILCYSINSGVTLTISNISIIIIIGISCGANCPDDDGRPLIPFRPHENPISHIDFRHRRRCSESDANLANEFHPHVSQ